MYERWRKTYEEYHDIGKEEEIKNKISLLVNEPSKHIIVECILNKCYISINFSEEKSVSFCKFLIENLNKKIGGDAGFDNAYVEFTHKGSGIYKSIIQNGKIEDLYINFEGGE